MSEIGPDGVKLASGYDDGSNGYQYGRTLQFNGTQLIVVQAHSVGGSSGYHVGAYIRVNGTHIMSAGRSWGHCVISGGGTNKGQVLKTKTHDVYSQGATAETALMNDIATYNTNANVQIFITFDEPHGSSGNLKSLLTNSYGAKLSLAPMSSRGAYAYAFRHSYGALAEQHSAYFSGSTLSTSGTNNARCSAGIRFVEVL